MVEEFIFNRIYNIGLYRDTFSFNALEAFVFHYARMHISYYNNKID